MVGWYHQLNEHELEQASGAGDGQGSLACCSACGHSVRHNQATELKTAQRYCSVYPLSMYVCLGAVADRRDQDFAALLFADCSSLVSTFPPSLNWHLFESSHWDSRKVLEAK